MIIKQAQPEKTRLESGSLTNLNHAQLSLRKLTLTLKILVSSTRIIINTTPHPNHSPASNQLWLLYLIRHLEIDLALFTILIWPEVEWPSVDPPTKLCLIGPKVDWPDPDSPTKLCDYLKSIFMPDLIWRVRTGIVILTIACPKINFRSTAWPDLARPISMVFSQPWQKTHPK